MLPIFLLWVSTKNIVLCQVIVTAKYYLRFYQESSFQSKAYKKMWASIERVTDSVSVDYWDSSLFNTEMSFRDTSPEGFISLAEETFQFRHLSPDTVSWKFKAKFGIPPLSASKAWNIVQHGNDTLQSTHLPWIIFFFKFYYTESANSSVWGCDEKIFRKWTSITAKLLAALPSVR